jgi:hypothetical protein
MTMTTSFEDYTYCLNYRYSKLDPNLVGETRSQSQSSSCIEVAISWYAISCVQRREDTISTKREQKMIDSLSLTKKGSFKILRKSLKSLTSVFVTKMIRLSVCLTVQIVPRKFQRLLLKPPLS